MNGFLTWDEAYQAGPSVCGGKGYNLARLVRYGFRVPRGGVLPADAPLEALRSGLAAMGLADAAVAVRSSATGEDSARASFAGIHRSFLNVCGIGAVEEAARGCIASLDTEEAQAYRQRMGFSEGEVKCAVVVCEMVNARCAGVAFSCDPATGRRDLVLIDAAEGLGDAVVSGRVNPRRMKWRSYTGLMRREPDSAGLDALPAAVEEELVLTVQRVHWALGEGQDPQDVEWAFDGERLWLLQARPVTRLPRVGWPETAAMPRHWSTANIKDAVPGVVSEYSWSILYDVVGDAAYAAPLGAGYPLPPGMEIVRRFSGHGYFDITTMQWALYDALGMAPADLVKALGGDQPEIPVPAPPLEGKEGDRRKKNGLRLMRKLWNYAKAAREACEGQFAEMRRLEAMDWSRMSREEILATAMPLAERQVAFVPVFGLANSCSGPWQHFLIGILKDDALIARLQTGVGGVSSAEQGYRVWDVAMGRATMEDFLREFGHRAVYEADIMNPRWAEDSSWVEAQVKAMRELPPARDPRTSAAEARQSAERELHRPGSAGRHPY